MVFPGALQRFMSSRVKDEDWVDTLNRFWTVFLLSACAVGSFLMRYVTEPVQCWTPAQFTSQHNAYADKVCFLQEDVYLPFDSDPIPRLDRRQKKIASFHQWIPLILFLQAVGFIAPNIIWKLLKKSLSFNLEETVSALRIAQVNDRQKGQIVVRDTAQIINSFLQNNRFMLSLLYIGVKIFYCLNLLGQFIFLTIFFHQELAMKVGSKIGLNIGSYQKPMLYKIVFCDFSITFRGTVHQYTVQCAVTITEMYEKIFVFLWYWVLLVALITTTNLIIWAGFLFIPFFRDRQISSYIKAFSRESGYSGDKWQMTQFISGFLGIDGVFLLSMVSGNSSELMAADLTNQLFQIFKETQSPAPVELTTVSGDPVNEESLEGQTIADAGVPEITVFPNEGAESESVPLVPFKMPVDTTENEVTRSSNNEKKMLEEADGDSSPTA